MKKNLLFVTLILSLLLSCCSSAKKAGNKNIPKSELQGMWQMSAEYVTKDQLLNGHTPRLYSTYKIIDPCGNFTNVIHNNKGTYITADGTYSFSETVYTEHVARSYTSPGFSGTDNKLTYEILDGKYMLLAYESNGHTIHEVWAKVQYGNPLR